MLLLTITLPAIGAVALVGALVGVLVGAWFWRRKKHRAKRTTNVRSEPTAIRPLGEGAPNANALADRFDDQQCDAKSPAAPTSSQGPLPVPTPPFRLHTGASFRSQAAARSTNPPLCRTTSTCSPTRHAPSIGEMPAHLVPAAAQLRAVRSHGSLAIRMGSQGRVLPSGWSGEAPAPSEVVQGVRKGETVGRLDPTVQALPAPAMVPERQEQDTPTQAALHLASEWPPPPTRPAPGFAVIEPPVVQQPGLALDQRSEWPPPPTRPAPGFAVIEPPVVQQPGLALDQRSHSSQWDLFSELDGGLQPSTFVKASTLLEEGPGGGGGVRLGLMPLHELHEVKALEVIIAAVRQRIRWRRLIRAPPAVGGESSMPQINSNQMAGEPWISTAAASRLQRARSHASPIRIAPRFVVQPPTLHATEEATPLQDSDAAASNSHTDTHLESADVRTDGGGVRLPPPKLVEVELPAPSLASTSDLMGHRSMRVDQTVEPVSRHIVAPPVPVPANESTESSEGQHDSSHMPSSSKTLTTTAPSIAETAASTPQVGPGPAAARRAAHMASGLWTLDPARRAARMASASRALSSTAHSGAATSAVPVEMEAEAEAAEAGVEAAAEAEASAWVAFLSPKHYAAVVLVQSCMRRNNARKEMTVLRECSTTRGDSAVLRDSPLEDGPAGGGGLRVRNEQLSLVTRAAADVASFASTSDLMGHRSMRADQTVEPVSRQMGAAISANEERQRSHGPTPPVMPLEAQEQEAPTPAASGASPHAASAAEDLQVDSGVTEPGDGSSGAHMANRQATSHRPRARALLAPKHGAALETSEWRCRQLTRQLTRQDMAPQLGRDEARRRSQWDLFSKLDGDLQPSTFVKASTLLEKGPGGGGGVRLGPMPLHDGTQVKALEVITAAARQWIKRRRQRSLDLVHPPTRTAHGSSVRSHVRLRGRRGASLG